MSGNQPTMPPMQDNVIEVSLKEVIIAIGGLYIGGMIFTFARDYAKFKRQKAVIDAAGRLVTYVINGGEIQCKELTMESSSPIPISEKPATSSGG